MLEEVTVSLARLRPGDKGEVVRLTAERDKRWRLLDLGLVPGTEVEAIRRSPLGDPTLYCFRGTFIALRKPDASVVEVRPF